MKTIKYFIDTQIEVSAPLGVLSCEHVGKEKIKISLDTTSLPKGTEGPFLVKLLKKDDNFIFPEKINWEISEVKSTKRPRFCIQVFSGDDKYRDFISDLTYSGEKNEVCMNNIKNNTTCIIFKFSEEFNKNTKFEIMVHAK